MTNLRPLALVPILLVALACEQKLSPEAQAAQDMAKSADQRVAMLEKELADIKAAKEGRSLLNWIADIRVGGPSPFRREDWSKQGSVQDVLKFFTDWKFDWLDVPGLISQATTVYEYPLMDREPFAAWTDGRATLLGDAAHPMYPMGSNGAAQAILDADAIAQALVAEPDVHKALERYEAERRPATANVVLANRQSGPERVMKLADDLAPQGFDDVENVLPYAERLAIADDYKRLAGFDVASVNAG